MTEIIHIPLNRLTAWKGNVRKTGIAEGIGELAASIAAHGLLQSLIVRKGKKGKYEIVAGQRRHIALLRLATEGKLDKDYPVPCMLAQESADASELSLAENVVRVAMHPADQFEAFRNLADNGAEPSAIAARFGVSESVVAKRLKLGRLSPVVLAAYRNDEISLDQAQAFAISDDHEAQERVFADLGEWHCSPDRIRRALTEHEIPTSDKRVKFIGIEAYLTAGGTLRQDLFSEANTGYVQDTALLDRLVSEKLTAAAADVKAEGWNWVETVADLDYGMLSPFRRVHPDHVDLPDDQQAELERLTGEYDDLVDTDDGDASEQLDAIQERIDALSAMAQSWPAEALAVAGAVVSIGYDGSLDIERGLVRKDDARKLAASADPAADAECAATPVLSASLIAELTAQKGAAIGAELIGQPDVALAAVVHALAFDALHIGSSADSCLQLKMRKPSLTGIASPETCKGLASIEQSLEQLRDWLPGDADALWSWCLRQSREDLLNVLAIIAAVSIDAVQRKGDTSGNARIVHADMLATALNVDMTTWFTPTATGYFSRVSRAQILVAIDEVNGSHAPALEKLKKAELAIRAEQLLAQSGWLPGPVRIASNDNGDAVLTQAAE